MYDILKKKENIIYLFDVIDESLAKCVIRNIINKSNLEYIVFMINSPGGSVVDALAIYDVLNFYREKIITVGAGVVASIATLLLCSANKGRRFVFNNTTLHIHKPFAVTELEEEKTKMMIAEERRLSNIVANLLNKHTDGKLVLDKIKKKDLIIDANLAIEKYFLADYIL